MIFGQILFFLSVFLLIFLVKSIKNRTKSQFFEYVPIVVVVYFVMMFVGNLRLIEPELIKSLSSIKLYLLSSMILLLLTKSNIREIYKLKTKLLATFFVSTLSIMASFILMWFLFRSFFDPDAYKAFGALCATWIGGMANMIAVAESIGADGQILGFCMISDSFNYAAWLAFLLFLVPHKDRFNSWSRASEIEVQIGYASVDVRRRDDLLTLFLALSLPFVIIFVSSLLPKSGFTNQTFWTVLISTIVGTLGSLSHLAHNRVSSRLGFEFLYFVIAITAVGASFDDFGKAPLFIVAGSFVLICHMVFMVAYAKAFRVDLFSISVSSLANIGGVASAPILAANYSANLVGVGVIMAMLGYIVGTFCALITTAVMALM